MKSVCINDQHSTAQEHMKKGQFGLALSILAPELRFNPKSIPLMIDVASCYYMVGDYMSYKSQTLSLLSQFEKRQAQLSEQEHKSTLLALVRLLEELGEVGLCFNLFKKYAPAEVKHRLDWKIIAQRLRLNASFAVESQIADLYKQCEFLNLKNENTMVDLQGALLIADWNFFGQQVAEERLKSFLLDPQRVDFEKRLLIFDHVYESLRRGVQNKVDESLFEHVNFFECDPFEQLCWDLYLERDGRQPHLSVSQQRLQGISPMGQIKLLYVMGVIGSKGHLDVKLEINRKLNFMLNDLNLQSRQLFTKYWPIKERMLEVRLESDNLMVNGQQLSLKKSSSAKILLESLSQENSGSTADLIRKIWNHEFDELTYSRLRVLITRLNSMLTQLTGFDRPVSMNKEFVRLNPNLVIRRAHG